MNDALRSTLELFARYRSCGSVTYPDGTVVQVLQVPTLEGPPTEAMTPEERAETEKRRYYEDLLGRSVAKDELERLPD